MTPVTKTLDPLEKGRDDRRSVTVDGHLATSFVPVAMSPGHEDDGSVTTATPTGIKEVGNAVTTDGVIGDGPHGSRGDGRGDFDFYRVDADAGQTISVKVRSRSGTLDSAVTLYDASGNVVATADDVPGGTNTTLIETVGIGGIYHVMISASGSRPADPFDSAGGNGVTSEGPYTLDISAGVVAATDYTVCLRKGDVIGAAVDGVPDKVAIYRPGGTEAEGSTGNVAHNHPAKSPLPSGKLSADDIADRTGVYRVRVSGDVTGSYTLTVLTTRPNLERTGRVQTIVLDFAGARLDPSIFAGAGLPPVAAGPRATSPMRSFLDGWGLDASDELPLSDAITAAVRRSVQADVDASNVNHRFAVRVLNGARDPEPADPSDVDHVIVGGTVAETGLPTLGVSTSIDTGNFDTQDTSIIMLDVLSGSADNTSSLNHYMTPQSNRIAYISRVIANLVSHEIGHSVGNWHTTSDDGVFGLMDHDKSFMDPGPDGIGGTFDDPAPQHFGVDTFSPADGLSGTEDTLTRTAFGLSH
ncbi:pre-peptidase C-terminal domain-containing protein [Embleya hyalina]|nr:pre-peptidase C-terminal domain-containing protein [Embleya hyalina]